MRPAPTRNLRCALTEFSHRRRSHIQLNDTGIGGLSYQQGTRTLWATGRHLRHKTGAPYITFLFSSLYLSRHDRVEARGGGPTLLLATRVAHPLPNKDLNSLSLDHCRACLSMRHSLH